MNRSETELNSPSRLLSLPAEIRNLIYEYTLTDTHAAFVVCNSPDFRTRWFPNKPKHPRIAHAIQPPLSRICQQLRRETLPYFYGYAAFGVDLVPSQTDHTKIKDIKVDDFRFLATNLHLVKRLLVIARAPGTDDLSEFSVDVRNGMASAELEGCHLSSELGLFQLSVDIVEKFRTARSMLQGAVNERARGMRDSKVKDLVELIEIFRRIDFQT